MKDGPHLAAYLSTIPLERSASSELQDQVRLVAGSPIVRALLDAFDGGMLVLNSRRQIVAANLRHLLAMPEDAALKAIGLRPGEALGCIHARERPDGCGAAEACQGCGALRAILGCQASGEPVDGECLLTATDGELRPLELRLRATPITVEGEPFMVLALSDASDEKRRSILEQVFFHDLLNLLTPLSNWAQILRSVSVNRPKDAGERVAQLVERLAGEVNAQRALLHAEHGTLELAVAPTSTEGVLATLAAAFGEHPLSRGRTVLIERGVDLQVETDRVLLLRILTNMVTNALEATAEGGQVRVWCDQPEGAPWACAFHVQNGAVMPREVAAQVFQRSFSTKAKKGRGLGTYSMKLIGERYLGGDVSFISREGEGTTFTFRLPARPSRSQVRPEPTG